MSVEYVSRFEDRIDAVDAVFDMKQFEPLIRKAKRWAVIKGLILTVLCGAAVLGLTSWRRGRTLSLTGYVFLLTPCVLFGIWWMHRFLLTPIIRSQVMRVGYDAFRAQAGPGIDELNRFEITDEALLCSDDWQQTEMRWPCIRKIQRGPLITALQILDSRWIIIPKRAFESEDAYRWFVDEIEARNDAAGGASWLITRHLSNYELRCAKCGYQLHKNRDAVCPECGRTIEFDDFRSHTTELAATDPENI
tara:strand:- start:1085 stop:1831 length:747 start_codon:yes stop_codon:yes gene_type:complete